MPFTALHDLGLHCFLNLMSYFSVTLLQPDRHPGCFSNMSAQFCLRAFALAFSLPEIDSLFESQPVKNTFSDHSVINISQVFHYFLCFHHTVYHNLIYFVIFCYCCFVFSRKCMEAFWRPEFAHFSSPVYPKRWAQHLTEDKTHKGYKILPLLYFGENMLAGHSIMDACRRQRLLGQK
jgi:hypothetical protein